MSASKKVREKLPNNGRTINVYEIWDQDGRDASKSRMIELPNQRSTISVNEIWNLNSDNLRNFGRASVNRPPRRAWIMFNAWINKLGQLLVGKP